MYLWNCITVHLRWVIVLSTLNLTEAASTKCLAESSHLVALVVCVLVLWCNIVSAAVMHPELSYVVTFQCFLFGAVVEDGFRLYATLTL